MRMRLITMLGALGFVASSALAQDTRDAEVAQADRQLNATYQALLRQLGDKDREALRAAQRTWIIFRDADCSFGWGDPRDCLMQRTNEREQQLRDSVYFDSRGTFIRLPRPTE